jgi:FixJ family two-component response regulator
MRTHRRVAVVDDDLSVRRAIVRLLRSAGLDADDYGSGREFLHALDVAIPDCVVLDVQMPHMSGPELQQRLRDDGISLPIVILTGHDEPDMQASCLAAGACAYLHKPVDGKTLVEAVNRAISAAALLKR